MPYFITKSYFERLFRRFALADTAPRQGLFQLSNLVMPTTDADKVLATNLLYNAGNVSVGAVGYVTALTVPVGKRWRLFTFFTNKQSGTYTFNVGLYVYDGTNRITIKATGTSAADFISVPTDQLFNLTLEAGWLVQVYCDGFTGAGNIQPVCLVEEQDAY